MKTIKFIFFQYLFLFLFLNANALAKTITIDGLSKLTLSDIQALTDFDINANDYDNQKVNEFIKILYKSDLIIDVNFTENIDSFSILIKENFIIENIYINGNLRIDDEIIKSAISSREKSLLNKNTIANDINVIRNFYYSQGFYNTSINVITENISSDKKNLIFQITENNYAKISDINFLGNKTFSDRVLSSIIFSDTKSDFNIFGKGSNLNPEIFNFDKLKLQEYYKDRGFNSVDINYKLSKSNFSTYSIDFYINENYRTKILDVKFTYIQNLNMSSDVLLKFTKEFENNLFKNNSYYDFTIINEFLSKTNNFLISQNLVNKLVNIKVNESNGDYNLEFYLEEITPKVIEKVNITGNSITKDSTLRSKLTIEPGDFFNRFIFQKDLNYLKSFRYINNVESEIIENQSTVSINLDINENKKTGNILLAGTANSDTGLGASFGINDDNIFGLGDRVDTSISFNSKSLLFNIDYQQYFTSNPYLSNRYKIFNTEIDYTSSYGYKSKRTGFSYSLFYEIDNSKSSNIGIDFTNNQNHSATIISDQSISDSIGDFNNFKIFYSLTDDTRNDKFYPSKGTYNRLLLEFSPDEISDDPFIRIVLRNSIFIDNSLNSNFFFIDNNLGIAESLDGKLKTKETFSLGGLNFKGFQYNGIGPSNSNNIYLGGNKYFTSTVGFGSKFLFDEKDNVNMKLFYTIGSLWDSDYINSEFKLRSSAGISFDFLTAIGPISFSYSMPINKSNSDESKNFNFTIGTSF